jgi:hypothetical protein
MAQQELSFTNPTRTHFESKMSPATVLEGFWRTEGAVLSKEGSTLALWNYPNYL